LLILITEVHTVTGLWTWGPMNLK